MHWNLSSDAPIYAQLTEQLQRAIASGDFSPGERLPSVRDLATEAGVNPNTMQRALSQLEQEALVRSQRTAGRFVTEDFRRIDQLKRCLARQHLRDFLSAMEALGYSSHEINDLLRQELREEASHDPDSGM